jgi:hypothetical protein
VADEALVFFERRLENEKIERRRGTKGACLDLALLVFRRIDRSKIDMKREGGREGGRVRTSRRGVQVEDIV